MHNGKFYTFFQQNMTFQKHVGNDLLDVCHFIQYCNKFVGFFLIDNIWNIMINDLRWQQEWRKLPRGHVLLRKKKKAEEDERGKNLSRLKSYEELHVFAWTFLA